MSRSPAVLALMLLGLLAPSPTLGQETPLAQPWDYTAAMKRVAAKSEARPGVVLHIGDSITYSNPYGQWARNGQGQTEEDKAVLAWMHTGTDDDSDGWWLARFDHPDGGRSYTACGGLRAEELLAGGKQNMPSLKELLETYRPQIVVLMIGTNDASAGRPLAAYRADMVKAVDQILHHGAICILSTIPPHPGRRELAQAYNEALRALAKDRHLPLIDFEREILRRRPNDWNGTLLNKDDVHPTAERAGVTAASAPTAENLRNSGYLLRGWLSVRKIAEVKKTVLDALPSPKVATEPKKTAKPPLTGTRVPVTRDTWLSEVGPEADGSNGGAARLKVKSYQEMSIVDLDPRPLRGRTIRGATLHLRAADGPRLRRITVGSIGAEWVEGTAQNYEPQPGSSTFHHRRHPSAPWTIPGSDLCSVIFNQGGTTWRMADASEPDAQGWQTVTVDPLVVAARIAGISYGFLVFDDTGSEWTREGERFTLSPFPNRFLFSRDSNRESAPYFTLAFGPDDKSPPEAPSDLRSAITDLPSGEAWVSWVTPRDRGGAGTIGFFVKVDGKDVPRYLIPMAGPPGARVRMHVRDLDLKPGAEVKLAIRAVDGAGNLGPALEGQARVSNHEPKPLPGTTPKTSEGRGPLPRIGGAEIAVMDELDKVHPVTAAMIPPQPEGYLTANHLWNAAAKRVTLHAARNEFIGLQILARGNVRGLRPSLTFEGADGPKLRASFGRYRHVESKNGPLPDPIVPLAGPLDIPTPDESIADQHSASLYTELYVPHDAKPGEQRGKLTLKAGNDSLTIDVVLHVWDFTLPDYLSFLPEMNCYGLPDNERDYYRLAHLHRTFLNRVPYYQNGTIADGCAPRWDGKKLDWSAWDRRFGPYFDGSAFADLPRKKVPLEVFYLPLHENWPTPMEGNYNGDYWADRAFPERYRRNFVEVARRMAEHFHAKKWGDTLFLGFLNNKIDFKSNGWSRGSSPWLLDEPAHFQDFWALRFFGAAFHEGVGQTKGPAKLLFRCDISRPEWQRDSLDGLLDYLVVGGAMRPYHRIVMDRKAAEGQIVLEYSSSNAIEDPNVQPAGWCLDAWSLGCDGVVPWQTVGNADSWIKADQLALFYPGRGGRETGPIPSIRLKAYRRGQQDVEYLTWLAKVENEPRWAIGQRVRETLHLAPEQRGTGFQGEDAGVIHFSQLKPQDLWALRVRVGRAISDAHPAPQRRLIEWKTPPRDPSKLTNAEARVPGGRP
jgi:hypothetical protein